MFRWCLMVRNKLKSSLCVSGVNTPRNGAGVWGPIIVIIRVGVVLRATEAIDHNAKPVTRARFRKELRLVLS